ncbi:MAG: indolepyruvate ferredoxin oxidoreductase family protein [Gemmatimonadota bacterium]
MRRAGGRPAGCGGASVTGEFTLEDRYRREDGTVYVTGIQALVRMLLDRARADRRAGHQTATYVTGYEGSPLGGLDLELARNTALLAEHGIEPQPGLNEELAATAVSGTQQARSVADLKYAGVTGVWYGKTPGLDRASDALRHGNLIGADPRGGALVLAGDDPGAKSSTIPGSSELALADLGMPVFYPADPAEILEFGLHAVELSRASGLWAALKVATVVADGATTAALRPWNPPDLAGLPGGLTAYAHQPTSRLLGATLAGLERSFHETRLPIAAEYARRSGLNRITGPADARIGIISAGATYLALRQALSSLGLDGAGLARAGIRLLKLGVLFPLEPAAVREFARGLDRVIVVEEKRAFLEDAVKSVLYGTPQAPAVHGKHGPDGAPLLAPFGELDADAIAGGLARWLAGAGVAGLAEPPAPRQRTTLPLAARTPYFCSGCPHNSSTEVAPGTLVGGGIGCHAMVLLMPGERTGRVAGLTQMGGEGAQWIGMAPFVGERHFVQNIGDGTFAHSGSLAVRAAVAAGVNVTFKLLRNSAVAMTGGQQPVGELSLRQLVALLEAEGARRVVVTSEDPARVREQAGRGVTVRHRRDLLAVQAELAAIEGVTVLIHDQECAAEKRRKRRRGKAQPPAQRVFINERVCEGCGDCGAKSNCLSVQPVATEFGRKTQINQSSCNLDFSCLAGDCPSFLTVVPGRTGPQQAAPAQPAEVTPPAEPELVVPDGGFSMRITGIGGTGVVTVSQVLATAAAIEGRSVRTLDQTGLAQKGGAVVSDLTITRGGHDRSPKLAAGECDLYLGCDALVAADPGNLKVTGPARTTAVISRSEVPTGGMVVTTTAAYPAHDQVAQAFAGAVRDARFVDAAALARRHLGDEQYANMIMVGAAYQCGALPLTAAAIERALGLNGRAVAANVAAFRLGRLAVAQPPATGAAGTGGGDTAGAEDVTDLDTLVRRRADDLAAYQNAAYADSYTAAVARVRDAEAGIDPRLPLAAAVARNLHKLMAYKDEYEVARLSLDPQLAAGITAQFGPGARVRYQLHPPVLRALGMNRKVSLGPWFRPVFRALAGLRRLRGTPFDPFGRTAVRRTERALITEYRATLDRLLAGLTPENHELAAEIAGLPDLVRGYEEIKLGNVAAYRDKTAELLARYTASPEPAEAAAD